MKKSWRFTNIFMCTECHWSHEYEGWTLPESDSCPGCGEATLRRQVETEDGLLLDYNPKIHNLKGE